MSEAPACGLAVPVPVLPARPEAVPEGVLEALPDAVSVGFAVSVGGVLGLVAVVLGTAARAAHSLSITEREETMLFASSRLVAVIEDWTFACSEVGSPETVTVPEL